MSAMNMNIDIPDYDEHSSEDDQKLIPNKGITGKG
jgi:hypothetical protein